MNRIVATVQMHGQRIGLSPEQLNHFPEFDELYDSIEKAFAPVHFLIKERFWKVLLPGDRHHLHEYQIEYSEYKADTWEIHFSYDVPETARPSVERYLNSFKLDEFENCVIEQNELPGDFLRYERGFWCALSEACELEVILDYFLHSERLNTNGLGAFEYKNGVETTQIEHQVWQCLRMSALKHDIESEIASAIT